MLSFPVPASRRGDFLLRDGLQVEYRPRPEIDAHVYIVRNVFGTISCVARITRMHYERSGNALTEAFIDDYILLRFWAASHLTLIDGGLAYASRDF